MVTAAALGTLAGLAPGRVSAAFGTGLTGRMLLGERPMRWAEVEHYVEAVHALLRGEEISWEGSLVRMPRPAGFAAARPADIDVLIAADGLKGRAVAARLGDGVFCLLARQTRRAPGGADLRHGPRRGREPGEPAGDRGRRGQAAGRPGLARRGRGGGGAKEGDFSRPVTGVAAAFLIRLTSQ
jgi:alkanesulfonate monooxygenase SsuD/methylene tetrahydromethanopterin reductase-like flavin-dependent oxidoreductase (luciferase family)